MIDWKQHIKCWLLPNLFKTQGHRSTSGRTIRLANNRDVTGRQLLDCIWVHDSVMDIRFDKQLMKENRRYGFHRISERITRFSASRRCLDSACESPSQVCKVQCGLLDLLVWDSSEHCHDSQDLWGSLSFSLAWGDSNIHVHGNGTPTMTRPSSSTFLALRSITEGLSTVQVEGENGCMDLAFSTILHI